MKLEAVKEMTNGDVNLKIAEILGWKKGPCGCGQHYCSKEVRFQDPDGRWVDECPDFAIDLNAMAEVEKMILSEGGTGSEFDIYSEYVEALSQVFPGNPIFAGPHFRAVAFLMVMVK